MDEVLKELSNQTGHKQNCPDDKPFYDGEKCIDCQSPKDLFDISKKVCTQCAEGTSFNISSRKCVPEENGGKVAAAGQPSTNETASSN